MTITPDAKDWTWVLRRACPECGFDTRAIRRENLPALFLVNAGEWRQVLAGPEVRRRPQPDVWSPLEYGCHVRDVYRRFDERLHMMLDQDNPRFYNWDQDATAIEDRYGEQDPKLVAGELVEAAIAIADSFAAVRGEQWERTGSRADGAHFTVESFGRYLAHDPIHHLYDVTGRPAG